MTNTEVPAVYVRDAKKCYTQDCPVLSDFSMTVPKGSIYGLLGASGCGKTTILSCIVGRNHLDSGEIFVLGGRPGTVGSHIPGPGVGYMPQETALCSEFSAKETLYFFGRLMKLSHSTIEKRYYELKELLQLPPSNRLVKNCSGGQQRRISFAAALIHKPDLLILDEPTAGVDPLLRDRIWTYMKDITMKQQTTVIITTHYIEESRQADFIGLMRGGKVLAEAPPESLVELFKTETVEDVFLELCLKQDKISPNSSSSTVSMSNYPSSVIQENICQMSQENLFPLMTTTKPILDENGLKQPSALDMNKNRLRTLLDKNWKQLYRNVSGWIFLLLILPVLCSVIFIFVIGADIRDLNFAIINEDSVCHNATWDTSLVPTDEGLCHLENLGCFFIEILEKEPLFINKLVGSLSEALDGIRAAKYAGAIYIPKNHSSAFEERILSAHKTPTEILDLSTIKVYLDMSDYIVGTTSQATLLKLFITHLRKLEKKCNYDEFMTRIISFKSVYDINYGSSTETMIPGFFISFISYMSTMLTSEIIVSERLSGVWDRSAVAGVTVVEILFTHFILQFTVMVVQMFEVLSVIFVIYGAELHGSFWILSLFGVLQGVYGICFGFLMSILSNSYFDANVYIAGGFYPTILISGAFWPVESQPKLLKWISSMSPFTIPTESFRNVLRKGWDLTYAGVLKGLSVEIIWIIIMTVLSIHFLKKRQ